MSGELLRLRLERVRYGAHVALSDVALTVRAGEIVGVAGHVGAGKTTLALAAAGLLGRATQATVDGDVTHPAGGDPPASFVFANPWTQLTDLGGTVEEEVAVGPENLGLAPAVIRARVDRALALADGSALAARIPRELSGGEMQRVALASALALEAPLVVLDEPTAQLDPENEQAVRESMASLCAGRSVLLIAHRLTTVADADRIAVLAEGRVVEHGTHRGLLAAGGRYAAMVAAYGGLR